jgi:hypothetical protein
LRIGFSGSAQPCHLDQEVATLLTFSTFLFVSFEDGDDAKGGDGGVDPVGLDGEVLLLTYP